MWFLVSVVDRRFVLLLSSIAAELQGMSQKFCIARSIERISIMNIATISAVSISK
jgi:hypothetical protein